MAFLPRPVTMMMLVRPAATASSITYWMIGLSTSGSISFGCALVAGRKRVPRPAAGKTALRMRGMSDASIPSNARREDGGRRPRGGGGGAAPPRVRLPAAGDPWAKDAERRAVLGEVEQLRHRQRLAGEEIARRGRAKEDTSALKAEMKDVSDRIRRWRRSWRRSSAASRRDAPGAERARCRGARGRGSAAGGAPRRRAADRWLSRRRRTGTSAPSSASSTSSARPRSPARGSRCRGARGRGWSARWPRSCSTSTRASAATPRCCPPYLVNAETLHRHRPAAEVRGRPLQDPGRGQGPLPDPHRGGPAHQPPPRRDPRGGGPAAEVRGLRRRASAREAGSYGKDVRGLIRQHQFHKVELVKLATPETSMDELESMVADAEEVLKRLGLRLSRDAARRRGHGLLVRQDLRHRGVAARAAGLPRDLVAARTAPTSRPAARALRYRPEPKGKPRFVHTLNGSGLAVGRTLVAVLENYQQADGSVVIPDALRPYMGGLERITRPVITALTAPIAPQERPMQRRRASISAAREAAVRAAAGSSPAGSRTPALSSAACRRAAWRAARPGPRRRGR